MRRPIGFNQTEADFEAAAKAAGRTGRGGSHLADDNWMVDLLTGQIVELHEAGFGFVFGGDMRSEEEMLRDIFAAHFAIPGDDKESVELLAKLAHTQKHKATPAMDLASDSLIEITPDIYGGLEFPMEKVIGSSVS